MKVITLGIAVTFELANVCAHWPIGRLLRVRSVFPQVNGHPGVGNGVFPFSSMPNGNAYYSENNWAAATSGWQRVAAVTEPAVFQGDETGPSLEPVTLLSEFWAWLQLTPSLIFHQSKPSVCLICNSDTRKQPIPPVFHAFRRSSSFMSDSPPVASSPGLITAPCGTKRTLRL